MGDAYTTTFQHEPIRADKGYDYSRCRQALRRRGIIPRIARRGVESRERLGRYRWVVERTLSWLNRFRRVKVRYERGADIHQAFLSLGCSLICLQALLRSSGSMAPRRQSSRV